MRHVLFTTAWYPNRKVAGDGVFVRQHALAVARRHRVAVLMVQTDVAVGHRRVEIEVTSGGQEGMLWEIRVYVPRIDREWPAVTSLLRLFWYAVGTWRGYRVVRRCWQGKRPDVCHVNVLTRAAWLPWWLSWRHRIPYIITEHWSRYGRPCEFPAGRLHLWWTRRVVRAAAYVCPVSDNLRDNMLRWGLHHPRYELVGNVVDTDTFTPSPMPTVRVKRIVHVSWMRDDAKNISGMLRVVARLRKRRDDFEFWLVGEGNDRPRLEDLSRQLGMERFTTFQPAQSGTALADTLRSSTFLLMFSRYENQPVSALEAMACGRPVVATRVGDLAMMTEGRGVLVAPEDEEALLEALDKMLDHYVDYDPATLHSYVAAHHAPEAVAAHFATLYRKAIEHDF